jgi:hypothetical protein
MPAKRNVVAFDDGEWDSEDSEGEASTDRVVREVEVVPGTRSIGTWIDGSEAVVRVEIDPWA